MYIATCYVRIGGTMFTHGECIPEDIPEEKLRWLIEAEAVEYSPDSFPFAIPEDGAAADSDADEPEDTDGAYSDTEAAEAAEEVEEDYGEAPEIDVMAGLVQDGEQENGKAAQKSGKKAAERRKTK